MTYSLDSLNNSPSRVQGASQSGLSRFASELGLVGDCDFEGLRDVASAMTPVPGGVGPMTIAQLLANTLEAYQEHVG